MFSSLLDFFKNLFKKIFGGSNSNNSTTPIVISYPDDKEPIKAIMATDMGCIPDLERLRDNDLKILRNYYNTVYFVADLPDKSYGGEGKVRPYIVPGRTTTAVTDVLVNNIKLICNKYNFRVMLTLCNEPSVRKGLSCYMSGWNYKLVPTSLWYGRERLDCDISAYKDLISKAGKYIYAIVLYLEPSKRESINYCRVLAETIRKTGWNGRLYSNGIGEGYWSGDATLNVGKASSLNNLKAWLGSKEDLKNGDGFSELNEKTASDLIPKLVNSPGKDGFILWFDEYRGSPDGPGKLREYMYKYVK